MNIIHRSDFADGPYRPPAEPTLLRRLVQALLLLGFGGFVLAALILMGLGARVVLQSL